MERKKFDDDFLEPEVNQRQNSGNFDLDDLRVMSEGACMTLFKKYDKCRDIKTLTEKEMCEKLKKSLFECLRTSGKFYE